MHNDELSTQDQKQAQELVQKFSGIFSSDSKVAGCTSQIKHRINTGDTLPIRQTPRRMPLARRDEVRKLIE